MSNVQMVVALGFTALKSMVYVLFRRGHNLDIGHSLLDIGYSLLDIGHSLLDIGHFKPLFSSTAAKVLSLQ